MDEFQLIQRFFAAHSQDAVVGIGDDAAVVDLPAGEQLLSCVDSLLEGVHFPSDCAPLSIGYRALAVNLSDIAAMGGTPRWATLALSLPALDESWLAGFAQGFFQAADEFSVSLIGGDTTRGPLTISVQLMGSIPSGQAILRSGAKVGDSIYVSGTLGDASAAIDCWGSDKPVAQRLRERFCRPQPRVALGQSLRGVASAAIDVSDGLLADLSHVCVASGCAARIEFEQLPVSALLREFEGDELARKRALNGGDDYELCFCLPQGSVLADPTSAVKIGEIIDGQGVQVMQQGQAMEIYADGYRHF